MDEYRKNMENINPPKGLDERVLAAARAEAAGHNRKYQRHIRPAAVLIAAAMALLLCIGAAASGIYYSLVIMPGRGIVDTGAAVPLVLNEVIAFGERQIDYAVLERDETNELRVIVTDGMNDSADFDVHKLTGDKYSDFKVERKSYYSSLTADVDGVSYALSPIQEESGEEYSKFDVYVCNDFPDVRSFALSAPTGETAEIVLEEYSGANVIEHSYGPITLRVLPMAKGSRYVFFDVENSALGDEWAVEIPSAVTLICDNGEKGYITNYKGVYHSSEKADMYEIVGRMENGVTGRIVDFSFNELSHPMNAKLKNNYVEIMTSEINFTLPAEGETVILDEPIVLFDNGGFRIAASKVSIEDGELKFTVTGDDILSKPEGIELLFFYGSSIITDYDGRQLYRIVTSSGQLLEDTCQTLVYERTDDYSVSDRLQIKSVLESIHYYPEQE